MKLLISLAVLPLILASVDRSREFHSRNGVVKVKLNFDNQVYSRYELMRLWNDFKDTHSKNYESVEEEERRMKVFHQNHLRVQKHNREFDQGHHTFKLKINQFGDMTNKEFVKAMNGFRRNYGDSLAKGKGATFMVPQNAHIPDKVDWRDHGYVTPVKNQGHCGSCWSFSATGALEGQTKRKTGRLISLSEQNLVDCSISYGNHGCEGGLMDQAFQYIKDNGGLDTEAGYPYEAKDDTCRYDATKKGATDKGFMDVPSGDEDKLKAAIATAGPCSVAIDASHQTFQFYSGGVYYDPDCSSEALDHGVLAVGYGTEDGQDYWLIKNSWGETWGDQGYVKIARNRNNQCGVATQASYPLV